jgi:oligosaccharide repeat unit polymerase
MLDIITSPWIPFTLLFAVAVLARVSQGSWLAPSAFAGLAWSIYLFIPLFFAPEYQVSCLAVWLILLLVSSIQLGAYLMEGDPKDYEGPREIAEHKNLVSRLLWMVSLFALLSTCGVLYLAWLNMSENNLSFSQAGLLALGHLLSVARYSGEQEPALARVMFTWVYPSALLGGIAYVLAGSKKTKLLSLAAFVPALLFSAVEAARAGVLIAVCCWLTGFFATKVYLSSKHYHIFSSKSFLLAIGGVVLAGGFFVVTDAIRGNGGNQEFQILLNWARMKAATFGYLAVFSRWLTSGESLGLSLGSNTFAGLFDLVGFHARQTGLYTASVSLPGSEDSNIYTAFRGLIEDFSLPGAVLFCNVLGMCAGLAYKSTAEGRRRWIVVLSAFYAFLFWSPIVSLFIYNGLILAWIIGALALGTYHRKTEQSVAGMQGQVRGTL